jgi:transcriptional regulator with XRE-family HTH domain
MSQTELARQLGMSARSKGYISEIESGAKVPPPERILLLARLFGVTTDYLIRDELNEDRARGEAGEQQA